MIIEADWPGNGEGPALVSLSIAATELVDQAIGSQASVSWVFAGRAPSKEELDGLCPFLRPGADGFFEPNRGEYPPALADLSAAAPSGISFHLLESVSEILPDGKWGLDICLCGWGEEEGSESASDSDRESPEETLERLRMAAERIFPEWAERLGLGEPLRMEESAEFRVEWGSDRFLKALESESVRECAALAERHGLDRETLPARSEARKRL